MIDIYYENGYDVDRTYGIKKIIEYLKIKQINLKEMSCVDLFSGDGTFCTRLLAKEVKHIDCFEIVKDTYIRLKDNLANVSSVGEMLQEDSNKYFDNNIGAYDLIFADNPSLFSIKPIFSIPTFNPSSYTISG